MCSSDLLDFLWKTAKIWIFLGILQNLGFVEHSQNLDFCRKNLTPEWLEPPPRRRCWKHMETPCSAAVLPRPREPPTHPSLPSKPKARPSSPKPARAPPSSPKPTPNLPYLPTNPSVSCQMLPHCLRQIAASLAPCISSQQAFIH